MTEFDGGFILDREGLTLVSEVFGEDGKVNSHSNIWDDGFGDLDPIL